MGRTLEITLALSLIALVKLTTSIISCWRGIFILRLIIYVQLQEYICIDVRTRSLYPYIIISFVNVLSKRASQDISVATLGITEKGHICVNLRELKEKLHGEDEAILTYGANSEGIALKNRISKYRVAISDEREQNIISNGHIHNCR